MTDKDKNVIIRSLLTALIDTDAMLRCYVAPLTRQSQNASTRGQAEATIKINSIIIAFVRETCSDE